jgi:hypothetical protein
MKKIIVYLVSATIPVVETDATYTIVGGIDARDLP